MDSEILSQLKELGIKFVKQEGREAACLCPLHADKSPSFFFNLDTSKYQCFAGCLKGRGIHQLAFQLDKSLDIDAPTPMAHALRVAKFEKMPSVPNLPLAFENDGERYLLKRGLTKESIRKWNILYWTEMDSVVIPIEDVGYIRRNIKTKEYKTLPGTKIGSTLFGLQYFNPLKNSAILVEGSFDCIWMHQQGFDNTLAILHSDITQHQYTLLQGVTNKIYVMLDGDVAGGLGTLKLKHKLSSNFIVKCCHLPQEKDPDDLNKAELQKLLEESC
jgi:DNA primase